MHPSVTTVEYRALGEVRYRIRRFLNFSAAQARSIGLEPQQHQLLLAVRGMPPSAAPTIGAVAERLQILHHSAVSLANRSVDRGLLEKRTNPADQREVFLEITPRGHRLLDKLAALHKRELLAEAPALVAALNTLLSSGPDALGEAEAT